MSSLGTAAALPRRVPASSAHRGRSDRPGAGSRGRLSQTKVILTHNEIPSCCCGCWGGSVLLRPAPRAPAGISPEGEGAPAPAARSPAPRVRPQQERAGRAQRWHFSHPSVKSLHKARTVTVNPRAISMTRLQYRSPRANVLQQPRGARPRDGPSGCCSPSEG